MSEKGLTILSAIPLYARNVQDASGNQHRIFSKRSVLLEDRAGVGKTSFVQSLPYWLRLRDLDGEWVSPVVYGMSARMVGDPPMNIVDVDGQSASDPLLWLPLVRARTSALQGIPSILLIDELYALPDFHSAQFLYALQGESGMERVSIIASTNPRGYYSDELTMHPNLAQRFGFPLTNIASDELFMKSREMYEAGRYEPFYMPWVVRHEDHSDMYKQLRNLVRVALSSFDLDQRTEEGKYVSERSADWAVEQLIIAGEILEANRDNAAFRDVLSSVYSEYEESSPLLPMNLLTSILESRLGKVATSRVVSVISNVRPFDVRGFFSVIKQAGDDPSDVREAVERYLDEYLSASPVENLSLMIVVRSFAKLGMQLMAQPDPRTSKGVANLVAKLVRAYKDVEPDKIGSSVRVVISSIADYLVSQVHAISESLPADVRRFLLLNKRF
jgi:hypothetical protein